jgi:hypothetical protein
MKLAFYLWHIKLTKRVVIPKWKLCLRCTSSADSTFSRSTNKTPSRRWPPIPPCDQQTGPDQTGQDYCQSGRHHTSIYVTNCPRSNCSTKLGLHHGAQLWERAGVELWNVSSVLLRLCWAVDGIWAQRKIQMENLGTLKLTNSRLCEHGIDCPRNGVRTDWNM